MERRCMIAGRLRCFEEAALSRMSGCAAASAPFCALPANGFTARLNNA